MCSCGRRFISPLQCFLETVCYWTGDRTIWLRGSGINRGWKGGIVAAPSVEGNGSEVEWVFFGVDCF